MTDPKALSCSLSVRERLAAGEPVELLFRLSNSTSQPLYVLTWHTPLEGLLNRCLEVSRDGTELSYRGEMMKRGAPVASSYDAQFMSHVAPLPPALAL